MNPARLSIRHPVLVNLITVLVIVAGLVVYATLIRKEVFPPADVGIVFVSAFKPGSPPEDVMHELTIPLEREIRDLRGLEDVITISGDGLSQLVLRFEGDVDLDKALLDVQSRVSRARLPAEVEPPVVRELRIPMPVMSIGISVDPDELDRMRAAVGPELQSEDGVPFALERRLQRVARDLEQRLLDAFPELDFVSLAGMRDRELRIQSDPDRLRQHGVTLNELAVALAAANARIPPGVLRTPLEDVSVRASDPLAEHPRGLAHAASEVIVRSAEGGRSPLRVQHVAMAIDGFEDLSLRNRLYTEELAPPNRDDASSLAAITLTLYKKDDEDFLSLADRLEPFLEAQAQRITAEAPGVRLIPFGDRSQIIRDRLSTVESNGMIGLMVVVFVLFLFLHYRIALLAALGIPIALFGSMIVLWSLGFSANILSMFGLIMALGLVVDDAIIVAENAYRYIEQGMSPVAAALKGTKEVLGPVIAAVLTTVAAFSPLLAWGGVTGQFLAAIPIAVVAALAISLIECLFLLPSHVAEWADEPGKRKRRGLRPGRVLDIAFAWTHPLRRGFNRLYRKLVRVYSYVLVRCLRLRYLTLLLAVCVFAGSMWVLAAAGTAFLDFRQIDRFHFDLTLPEGTPIEEVGEIAAEVERIALEAVPPHTVAAISTTLGRYQDPSHVTRTSRNVAEVIVEFRTIQAYRDAVGADPPEDYRQSVNVERYFARMRHQLDALPLSEYHLYAEETGPPEGAPLEVLVRGDDYAEVTAASQAIRHELGEIRGLRDVSSTLELGGGEYRPRFDQEELAALGLTEAEVQEHLRTALTGRIATRVTRSDEEIDVVVQLTPEARASREDLFAVEIPTREGLVPLGSLIASFERSVGTTSIRRVDYKTAATIMGELDGITAREAVGLARPVVDRVLERFPSVEASYEGRFAAESRGFTELGFFALLALGLIYTILATVLRSFVQPFLIMAAIPLGFVGVAIGLYVMGEKFSLVSAIGAVALMGIIVNDSTILLHFANKQRRAGVNRWRAIVRASRIRLRPILLTTVTTIGGLFTISYAHYFGGFMGDEAFLAPMGIAISWGIAFGTVLLLLVVPCLFAVYEDVLAKMGVDPHDSQQLEDEIDAAIAQGVDTTLPSVGRILHEAQPTPVAGALASPPAPQPPSKPQQDSGSFQPVSVAPSRLIERRPTQDDSPQASNDDEPSGDEHTQQEGTDTRDGGGDGEGGDGVPREEWLDSEETQTAIEHLTSAFDQPRSRPAPPDPQELWHEDDDDEQQQEKKRKQDRERKPKVNMPTLPPRSGSSSATSSVTSGDVTLDKPVRTPEPSTLPRPHPEPSVSYPPSPQPVEENAPDDATTQDEDPPKPSEILKRRLQREQEQEATKSGETSEEDPSATAPPQTPPKLTDNSDPKKQPPKQNGSSDDYRI